MFRCLGGQVTSLLSNPLPLITTVEIKCTIFMPFTVGHKYRPFRIEKPLIKGSRHIDPTMPAQTAV